MILSSNTPRHVLGAALAARASRKVNPTVACMQHQLSDLRAKTGCTIVAMERGEESWVESGAELKFVSGVAVYVCGSAEAA